MNYSLPRLNYPTTNINGIEVYNIPEEDKEAVLKQLCPFVDVPALDEQRYDLHAEKTFYVRDFMVVRHETMDWLVSPYYLEGGGSVIDWVPVEEANDW